MTKLEKLKAAYDAAKAAAVDAYNAYYAPRDAADDTWNAAVDAAEAICRAADAAETAFYAELNKQKENSND